MSRSRLTDWTLGALAMALVATVSFRATARRVALNLGPGDAPFVSGFTSDRDVEDKVGWHWTTYDAAVDLPFVTAGADVDVTLRYARVFGEEAVAEVRVGDVQTTPFRSRGGEVRQTTVRAAGVLGPLHIAIKVDSHERRDMGLKLDRMTLFAASGEPFRLTRSAALWPLATCLLLFAGLLVLGAGPVAAGALSLLSAMGFAALAAGDLFAAWRGVSLLPGMILVAVPILLGAKEWMWRKGGITRADTVVLVAAALCAMTFRLALLSQPDFYYPDLLTHARVVAAIRAMGPSFFFDPAEALKAQGAWTKPVLGAVSSLPYAVMFHAPFAVLGGILHSSTDEIETLFKSAASLISVLPILMAAVIAARLSLPPLSALALCVIPTYTSRLSFALFPALLGHALDLFALVAITTFLADQGRTRSAWPWTRVAGALLLGHLAYTSSVVNEGVFMTILIVLCLAASRDERVIGLQLIAAEGFAALLAFGLYYSHFVGDAMGLAGRLLGVGEAHGSASSVYVIESFWAVLWERTDTFFGWSYVSLALAGAWMVRSVVRDSKVLRSWGLAYLCLILLRAKVPDVFRYGHETLFLTPLIGMFAGSAIILAFRKGGAWRLPSAAIALSLSIVSFIEQWRAVADQLGNAR